ncbi:hypothetical protein BEP19_04845 [Ammoniphilus oxalaticus]|uniref:ATP-grasp domain-containing protein n=1 Tax=Ammoniphilus oxalaticus TaxID=66863 RepID=A0A419SII0_9BACL|nr:YheC/YheD family protein [Ammoniphilus oxalaticus]RKD23760.1 hypothetical protein BEP19_04845 [Ammoniphilus oxalaticus]
MKKMRLGILTWRTKRYVEERTYFTHLAKAANQLNTDVFLFSPLDLLQSGEVRCLLYTREKGWIEQRCQPPDVVYDRFRNMQPNAFRTFLRFREQSNWTFLNSRMAHKWNLHRFLLQNKELNQWLPETIFLEQSREALQLLKRYDSIYVKPVNGTGGKGILSISKRNGAFRLLGRDLQRKVVKKNTTSPLELTRFITHWTKKSKYIAQQGLDLEWGTGLITDFRLLVQKDGDGQWTITGLGGKVGGKNSATSNLHGGGKAIQPERFFRQHFSEEKSKAIEAECEKLGLAVAEYIENKFGRLLELGIDLGIDTAGNVWIIEVNNKPGRDIFKQMGDLDRYRTAVRRPVEYARYIYERKGVD